MTFFLISIKRSSKLLPLLGRTVGSGLFRVTLLIFIYLPLHSTIFFMWLGRQVFEGDTACPRCLQAQDSFGYHALRYHIFGGKSVLHNMIRDEIYRTLREGYLHCRLEPNHLLPDSPGQRPADILMIPTALCRQSTWGLMPRIALDPYSSLKTIYLGSDAEDCA